MEQRYRYLLLLDEYELLDDKLPATTAEDFVTTLRAFTQQYPWLAVALVGLHTLQERSASYYQPIYTWRPLKVGLMNADAVADMLQVEDDSFPLEYSLEAVARVHDLTVGGSRHLQEGPVIMDSTISTVTIEEAQARLPELTYGLCLEAFYSIHALKPLREHRLPRLAL